jgi:hypothetical protein
MPHSALVGQGGLFHDRQDAAEELPAEEEKKEKEKEVTAN